METGLGFVFLKIAGLLGEWIGWLLIALGVLTWKSTGKSRALAAALFVITYLLAIPFGRNLLCAPLERPYPVPAAASIAAFHPQAVVVLGGGVMVSPLQGETVAAHALTRLAVGWRYAHDLQLPLLASGAAIHSRHSEGELMIQQAQAWGGIPEGIAESNAMTTRSNATQTAEHLKQRHLNRILLVTSAIHMRRSIRAFSQTELKVLPIPADPRWSTPTGWLFNILPSAGNLDDSAAALHEWVGYLAGR